MSRLHITEKNKIKDLEQWASLLKTTLESTADGILVVNLQGGIVTFNSKFAKMWNIPKHILKSLNDKRAIDWVLAQLRDPQAFVNKLMELYRKPSLNCLDEIEFLDGRIFERYSIPQRMGRKIIGRVFSFRDVTRRKKMEEKLLYQATHDALTGIPNRTILLDRIEHSIRHAQRTNSKVALVFLDLDRFKGINDTMGHNIGDLVLQECSKRLREVLRHEDTLSRWGGDEFAMVLEDIQDKETVSHVLRRCLRVLEDPIEIRSSIINTSCSMGVSFYPDDGDTAITLLKKADTAMYYAKNAGRHNFQFYSPEMTARAVELLEMENELKQALQKNHLSLNYQPIINVQENSIKSVEALLRWHHPDRGWISPAKFIPISEESGLIIPLGEWVIERVMKQVKEWEQKGLYSFKVAANISIQQLQAKNFIDVLKRTSDQAGIPPDRIILEVTETGFMENTNLFLNTLTELNNLGFEISIDDFGTGYSSLSYLHMFPIQKLKIDQSFIKTIDREGKHIVLAILALAKNLNLKTVAEGVETKTQYDFLRTNGCDEIQGFFFCKPVTPEKLEDYIIHGPSYKAAQRVS